MFNAFRIEYMIVPITQFKSRCLDFIDDVDRRHEEIIITKSGKPIARLVPVVDDAPPEGFFGILEGTVTIHGDIVGTIGEEWDVNET